MMKARFALLCLVIVLPAAAAVRVTVSPASVTLTTGTLTAFTVRVTGAGNDRRVTWSVTCGAITPIGVYTAPAQAGTCFIRAQHVRSGVAGQATALVTEPLPPGAEPPSPPASTCTGVDLGTDPAATVASHPAGTIYCLRPLTRIRATITPKNSDRFEGPGTLSGAVVLTGFQFDGTNYGLGGQSIEGSVHGECLPTYPRCNRSEELFLDRQRLRHVASLGELGPGLWYFDYPADRVYLRDNPAGKVVELSVQPTAFQGSATGVTLRHVTLEMFANPAQVGALAGEQTIAWTVEDSVVRLTHGVGIRIGTQMHVLRNIISGHGQLGIGGIGNDVLVEGNEIATNNQAGFNPGWEAGGTKFVRTDRLVVRNNWVHHNLGPGLWTDIENIRTLYEGNTSEDNLRMGIFHEISYDAVIRGNVVRRNGFGFLPWLWGAGILVAASPNVEITGNTVEGNADGIVGVQQNRGSGMYGPFYISNLWVHDNVVRQTAGQSGLAQDIGDSSIFTGRNNRFERNTYQEACGNRHWAWADAERTWIEWRAAGQDAAGSCTP